MVEVNAITKSYVLKSVDRAGNSYGERFEVVFEDDIIRVEQRDNGSLLLYKFQLDDFMEMLELVRKELS